QLVEVAEDEKLARREEIRRPVRPGHGGGVQLLAVMGLAHDLAGRGLFPALRLGLQGLLTTKLVVPGEREHGHGRPRFSDSPESRAWPGPWEAWPPPRRPSCGR